LAHWIQHLSPVAVYTVVFAWLFIESTGFPLSDEPLLLASGALARTGAVQLIPLILVALCGKVAASALAFAIGRRLDLERLARPAAPPTALSGRLLYLWRPRQKTVTRVQLFFRRYGTWSVFLGRLVPVARSFISYPAGAAGMAWGRFLVATTVGSALWIAGWTVAGATATSVVT
jgi:membrane protein DedA with SNARE-associated domain